MKSHTSLVAQQTRLSEDVYKRQKYYKTKDGVEYMMKNTTHTLNIFYKMLSANSIGVWKNVNTRCV